MSRHPRSRALHFFMIINNGVESEQSRVYIYSMGLIADGSCCVQWTRIGTRSAAPWPPAASSSRPRRRISRPGSGRRCGWRGKGRGPGRPRGRIRLDFFFFRREDGYIREVLCMDCAVLTLHACFLLASERGKHVLR